MLFRYWLVCFLLIPVFGSVAQTWIPVQDCRFDFSRMRRLESGPPGHIYALDEKMNLALIRFDTLKNKGTSKIKASVVRLIPLSYWPGNDKELRSFDFSSSSDDGRYLALSVSTKEIKGRETDGSYQTAPASEHLFLLDFPESRIDFRIATGKKTNSLFFGQTLRYSDYRSVDGRIMAKDPEDPKPRLLSGLEKTSINGNQKHLSISNHDFTDQEQLMIRDELQNLTYRIGKNRLVLEKEGYPSTTISLRTDTDMEIFRFRGKSLIVRHPMDSVFLVQPGSGQVKGMPIGSLTSMSGAIDFRSCLLNDQVLTGFSKGCFTFFDLKDGKWNQSLPIEYFPNPGIPLASTLSAAGLLTWKQTGKAFRFFPAGREFSFIPAILSDSNIQLPLRNSRKFRVRSTHFLQDSSKNKEDSEFAPGVFLNGNRIAGYAGNAPEEIFNLDIAESQNRAFLNYNQPRIIAVDAQSKPIWTVDQQSRIRALKIFEKEGSLFTWSENGVVDFLNSQTGKKYLSLAFDSSGKEWILWTPSGYFDASENGAQLVFWSGPGDESHFPGLFPMSSFASLFRKPELVDAVMLCRDEGTALKRLKAVGGESAQKLRLNQRPPEIYFEMPGDRLTFSAEVVKIPFFQIPGRLPLKKIQLWFDGKPLPDYLPDGMETLNLKLPQEDGLLEYLPYSAAGAGTKKSCMLKWIEGK
jgi:hypothetical protein